MQAHCTLCRRKDSGLRLETSHWVALWGLPGLLWGGGLFWAWRAEPPGWVEGLHWKHWWMERWREWYQPLGWESSHLQLTLSVLGSDLDNKGAEQGGENTNQEVTLFRRRNYKLQFNHIITLTLSSKLISSLASFHPLGEMNLNE
jgi:hypothetical protein